MRTEDLECFAVFIRCKTQMATQEALSLSQSAISERMKRLKLDVGAELYVQSSDGAITLTEVGQRVLDYAQEVVMLTNDLQHAQTEPVRVRLGLNVTAAHLWSGECLESLRREFPRLAFDLKVGTTNELGTMIREGSLDLTIGTRGFEGKRIEEQKLEPLAIVFVGQPIVPSKEQYTLQELAEHGFISYQIGADPYNELRDLLRVHNLQHTRVDAISSIEVMIQLLEAGCGIAALPRVLAERLRDRGLVELPCPVPLQPLQLWLSWRTRSDKPNSEKSAAYELVRSAVDHVRAYIAHASA